MTLAVKGKSVNRFKDPFLGTTIPKILDKNLTSHTYGSLQMLLTIEGLVMRNGLGVPSV